MIIGRGSRTAGRWIAKGAFDVKVANLNIVLCVFVGLFYSADIWASDLGPGIPIEGIVVDRDSREPIYWAQVTIDPGKREQKSGTLTGEDGRFSVTGLSEGSFVVLIEAGGFHPETRSLSETIGSKVSMEVALEKCEADESCAAIRGTVFEDRSGEPVRWANVIVLGTQRGALGWSQDGRFLVAGLEPGYYDIKIMRMGYKTVGLKVEATQSHSAPAVVRVRRTYVSH